ncbi:MAG: c-type cytochrome [Gammaproteobacteria bacterium]|nr:c-type cytochrome [Gammaproteobacteria bacterium]
MPLTIVLLCLSIPFQVQAQVELNKESQVSLSEKIIDSDDLIYRNLENLGGKHTIKARDKRSLSHAYDNLSDEEIDKFILGKSFFNIPWVEAPSATTARDGLGPLFNANTCLSCHSGNGAGFSLDQDGHINRSLVFRLSKQESQLDPQLKKIVTTQGFIADPVYGAQININGVHGVLFEGTPKVSYSTQTIQYADGQSIQLQMPKFSLINLNYGPLDKSTVISPRVALSLVGLGEIEKISEQDILANEDVEDRNNDGISGKANRVYSLEKKKSVLGRFSWKASAPTVKQQVASALHNDMSLTTPLINNENCTKFQHDCLEAQGSQSLEVPMKRLEAISYYISHLKVPAQRKTHSNRQGFKLFKKTGCSSCHKSSFVTSENNRIYPFSDFLLHDMGEALSDQRNEFLAQPREWRTPPLWGIGLAETLSNNVSYLHDGRARSIEEAILWHGGEAESITQKFKQLTKSERQSLIQFIRSI